MLENEEDILSDRRRIGKNARFIIIINKLSSQQLWKKRLILWIKIIYEEFYNNQLLIVDQLVSYSYATQRE